MKNVALVFSLFLVQFSFSQKTEVDYLFTGVSIVPMDTEAILSNKDIAIKDGKIVAITDNGKGRFITKNKINVKGKYVMPSLSDAHVHLPKEEKELLKMFDLYLLNGVTKLRSMRGDGGHILWREKYNQPDSFYPKMYLSSPPITRGLNANVTQIERYVAFVKENNFDFVKILSIKDETFFKSLDSICKKYDIKIGGHFLNSKNRPGVSDTVFFDSNSTSIEHLGGLIGEKDVFASRLERIKNKNIYSCPTLEWYIIGSGHYTIEEMKKFPGMEYVTNETKNKWIADANKYIIEKGKDVLDQEMKEDAIEIEERLSVVKTLNDRGFNLLLSPDNSANFMINGFSMFSEMKNYQRAGLSNFDILKTTTVNFANFFKDENYGTVEVGKNADFILLDKNPLQKLEALQNVQGVFYNNHYLDKTKLEQIAFKILAQ